MKQSIKKVITLISATVLIILGSQVYRTVDNYRNNQQRFVNDVQVALDLAVEKYYADKARNDIFVMAMGRNDTLSVSSFNHLELSADKRKLDSILRFSHEMNNPKNGDSSFSYSWFSNSTRRDTTHADQTLSITQQLDTLLRLNKLSKISVFKDDEDSTSTTGQTGIKSLTQKVMISISEDLMQLGQLTKIVKEELGRKNLSIDYQLEHTGDAGNTSIGDRDESWTLSTTSKTTYLPKGEVLTIYFENASLLILKKGLIDLLISLAIVLAVVGALWYLYRVINEQKEIAMIKDDLISNITHEFKTPIATISTAIEAIANFNKTNDKEKTDRYLGLSQDQLTKLNVMVEKLLETATIDSGEIQINLEETDLIKLTKKVVENHKVIAGGKSIAITTPTENTFHGIDPFHIESALSNIVDNAIKYGGNQIDVSLTIQRGRPVWRISDNGGNIEKAHRERIFEKLYRIPKGNQHDVKGFGIGLYYTKSIVEKHGGTIKLETQKDLTIFIIAL